MTRTNASRPLPSATASGQGSNSCPRGTRSSLRSGRTFGGLRPHRGRASGPSWWTRGRRLAMGRRSRGDGSVYYDSARGCWVGAVDLGRDPHTGKRRRPKLSAPTKTECKDKLDALRTEKRTRGTVGRQDTTVETVMRNLLANPPRGWRSPITVDVNTTHAQRITAAIGTIRLVKLTAGDD